MILLSHEDAIGKVNILYFTSPIFQHFSEMLGRI